MKKLFYLAFAAFAFVACGNDDTNEPAAPVKATIEVTTDVAALEIAHEGGEVEVAFKTNKDWTATNTDSVEGLEIDPPFGAAGENTITVTVGENTTEAERTLNVTLKAGDAEEVVAIKQLYVAAPYINTNLSETREFWCPAQASTVTLEIDANVEYTVALVDAPEWIQVSDNGEGVYTFTLEANPQAGYRSVVGTITCELYEQPLEFYIFQNGVAARAWVNELRELAGYNADAPCDLALYGDYLLVSNATNIFALNAADGTLAATYPMPEGVTVNSIEVDEGGNILICSTPVESIVTVYTTKSVDAAPAQLLKFHTGNLYAGGYGNIRVAGNIDTKALFILNACGYWTDAGNTMGYSMAYEINNGAPTLDANGWAEYTYIDQPVASNDETRACVYPLGTSLTDGALFVAYTPSIYMAADASVRPQAFAELANLGGNGWMENYAAIDVVEAGGKKVVGVIASCLFNYDQPDLVLLDLEAASLLGTYCFYDPTSETEDYAAAFKGNGVGTAEGADVVLVPTETGVKAYCTDSAWGAVSCVTYDIL